MFDQSFIMELSCKINESSLTLGSERAEMLGNEKYVSAWENLPDSCLLRALHRLEISKYVRTDDNFQREVQVCTNPFGFWLSSSSGYVTHRQQNLEEEKPDFNFATNFSFSPFGSSFFSPLIPIELVRPLTIRLDQDVKYLSANHSYDLKCEVTGSRPAPLISWWKGSTQLRTTREWVSMRKHHERMIW